MAVVMPGKLDNLVPPCKGPGHAQCAHGGLRARIDKSQEFHAWHEVHHQTGELQLQRARSAEARAAARSICNGAHNTRGRMPQQQRPERQRIIDIAIAVHVNQIGALSTRNEERLPAYGSKGARRGINSARQQLLRRFKKATGVFDVLHAFLSETRMLNIRGHLLCCPFSVRYAVGDADAAIGSAGEKEAG